MNDTEKLKDPDYFVIGLQKSGTFWVTALLDAHPQILCLPTHYKHGMTKGKTGADEGRIFDMLATVDEDGGKALKRSFTEHHGGFFSNIVPLIGSVSKKELHEAVRKRYLEWFAYHNKENKPIVGDKTTEYVFHLDLLDSFFPNAKKICILRDPKDRVVSWHFDQLRKGKKKEKQISDEWIRAYIEERVKKEYEAMFLYDGSIHCLTYEKLSTNPEEVIRGILAYLGAAISASIIEEMIEAGSLETLRGKDTLVHKDDQKKKQGETMLESHYRRGVSGDWQNHLSSHQADMIENGLSSLEKKLRTKYNID